jgi:glutamate carboxypeptidase
LGIIGGGAHAAEEYAELDSMVPRFYLLARMLMELGPGK